MQVEVKDEQERLVAEQAILAYRAVNEAADGAEFGHGMEAMEDVALEAGREHARQLLTTASQRRVAAEKGKRPNARGATGR